MMDTAHFEEEAERLSGLSAEAMQTEKTLYALRLSDSSRRAATELEQIDQELLALLGVDSRGEILEITTNASPLREQP